MQKDIKGKPHVALCFICGGPKNEVYIIEGLPDDKNIPDAVNVQGDYKPCSECEKRLVENILVLSVRDGTSGEELEHRTGQGVYVNRKLFEESFPETRGKRVIAIEESLFYTMFELVYNKKDDIVANDCDIKIDTTI